MLSGLNAYMLIKNQQQEPKKHQNKNNIKKNSMTIKPLVTKMHKVDG